MDKKSIELIALVTRRAKPYRKIALASVFAMICTAGFEPVLPALMKPLVDQSLIERDPVSLWKIPVLIILVFFIKGAADYIANVSSQYLSQKVMADLRAEVFDYQLALPVWRHHSETAGRMVSRITFDIAQMGEAISTAWITVIKDTLVLLALVGFLFFLSWPLALMIFAVAPALAWAIRRAGSQLRTSNRAVQGFIGRLTGFVEESMTGIKEIKIFGAQGQRSREFVDINKKLLKEMMRVIRVQAINVPLVQILAACSVALVIFMAGLLSQNNRLSPGEFVSFITAMSMVFEPVRRLTNVNAVLQKGLAAAESVFGLLEKNKEDYFYRPLEANEVKIYEPERLSGEIEFVGVSFAYPGRVGVIENFNLKVNSKESVALVGPSGSGKTTIFDLLAGFCRPDAGKVLIDGRPIEAIGLEVVRSNIAVVGQQVFLFEGTIRDNILMGRPSATDEEVKDAAQSANAWDFIVQLPNGLDTKIGSTGAGLSGGQRQRVAIARAYLKNSPILLLDEATSALDKDNEAAVLSGLKDLMRGRTVLFISHTPERLISMDKVVEITNGSPRLA